MLMLGRDANLSQLESLPYMLGTSYLVTNVASMTLYAGNPANIIAAQARQFTFLSYASVALLPALAACATLLAGMVLIYHQRVGVSKGHSLQLPDVRVGGTRASVTVSLLFSRSLRSQLAVSWCMTYLCGFLLHLLRSWGVFWTAASVEEISHN